MDVRKETVVIALGFDTNLMGSKEYRFYVVVIFLEWFRNIGGEDIVNVAKEVEHV